MLLKDRCICLQDESLILQDKYNIEIFLSPVSNYKKFNGYFKKTNRVSNNLDPDQVGHFVGPALSPNYLQITKIATGEECCLR